MRAAHKGAGGSAIGRWYLTLGWIGGVSVCAWALANLLDVVSVWVMVRSGERLAWALGHPAAGVLIYAQLRLLLTLAVALGVVSASRRWRWMAQVVWGMLPVFALATAAAAWWRLLR